MSLFIGVLTPGVDEREREDRDDRPDVRLVEAAGYEEARSRLIESFIDDHGEDEEEEGEPAGTLLVFMASDASDAEAGIRQSIILG